MLLGLEIFPLGLHFPFSSVPDYFRHTRIPAADMGIKSENNKALTPLLF